MWPSPQPKFKPAVWRFADAKKALDASHNMVPADQTERRNLIMVNPIEGNTYATTRNLVAAYQCVMPGDRARTHRHSAAALRLVLQGKEGVYTIVNGTRIDMQPGEVLLTPAFCWHGHANETARDRLLDRLPRHSVRSAHRGDVLRALPAGRPRSDHQHRPDPDADPGARGARRRHRRQDRRDRQGRDADHRAQSDPAAEGRQRADAEDDRERHLCGGVGQGALHRRRISTRPPASATSSPCRAGTSTPSRRRRTRWCSRCRTIRSSRSSGWRGRRIDE